MVIVDGPPNIEMSPGLRDLPRLVKETRTVKGGIFAEQVVVRHPESTVVAKSMVEFGHPLGSPFLAPITCLALVEAHSGSAYVLQGPVHSPSPQGFLKRQSLMPSISTALMME